MIFEITVSLLCVPVIYFVGCYLHHLWRLSKYPKGPFPLPIIGNLNLIGEKAFEQLKNLSKKYGDVYSISLGMERVVIVNSIEAAKEALVTRGADFAGRPSNLYTANIISRGGVDIAFADYGKQLRFMRKVAHQSLRMFGDGMEKIEHLVLEEWDSLHGRLMEMEGKPIDLHKSLGCSVLNVICFMVFGKRYETNDPEFHSVIEFSNLLVSGFSNGDAVAFLPWLRFFPLKNLKRLKKSIAIRDPILRKQLLEHKQNFDANNLKDFTDSLINLAQDQQQWKENGFKEVTVDHLEMIINDLFIAGSETTITTLRWAFTYLLHWPKYQEEVYQEIQDVIGDKSLPELSDRSNLHLVQAIIHETLRLSSLVPLGAPHKSITDSTIDGKHIPKDTQILFNIWAFHNDERHWDDPQVFNPHRWINDGKFDSNKNPSFLPFSAGRRVCLGEALAKTELFLFFSRLMSQFEILPDPNEKLPSLTGAIGITLSPLPFNVVLKSRK